MKRIKIFDTFLRYVALVSILILFVSCSKVDLKVNDVVDVKASIPSWHKDYIVTYEQIKTFENDDGATITELRKFSWQSTGGHIKDTINHATDNIVILGEKGSEAFLKSKGL